MAVESAMASGPGCLDQRTVDMKSYWVAKTESSCTPMVWDSFKATMRGSFAAAFGQAHKAS